MTNETQEQVERERISLEKVLEITKTILTSRSFPDVNLNPSVLEELYDISGDEFYARKYIEYQTRGKGVSAPPLLFGSAAMMAERIGDNYLAKKLYSSAIFRIEEFRKVAGTPGKREFNEGDNQTLEDYKRRLEKLQE
jgi:hypothetical protein